MITSPLLALTADVCADGGAPHARGLHEIVARESFNEGYDFQDVTKEERNVANDAAFFHLFYYTVAGKSKNHFLSFFF